jgi:hypothetical protein
MAADRCLVTAGAGVWMDEKGVSISGSSGAVPYLSAFPMIHAMKYSPHKYMLLAIA